MANILNKLTEGIVNRNVQREGEALLTKWEKTGLLEGLGDDHKRQSMASLLENQAKELLREANAMADGSVQGFAAVAFPIVRRVFGGLLANDLVSVQPMSLPSGLIFFLDFTFGSDRGFKAGDGTESVFGGDKVGSGITEGVGDIEETGFYSLSQGYSSARKSAEVATSATTGFVVEDAFDLNTHASEGLTEARQKALDYDADLLAQATATGDTSGTGTRVCMLSWPKHSTISTTSTLTTDDIELIARNGAATVSVSFAATGSELGVIAAGTQIRRLTKVGFNASGAVNSVKVVLIGDLTDVSAVTATGADSLETAVANEFVAVATTVSFALSDALEAAGGLGGIGGASPWELESSLESPFGNAVDANADGMNIPEIDIKVDSVAITAQTRKLKAKWSPELGQDLNAYHNLDAEVELTSILSEQIALEIDQEILKDLIVGAQGNTRYWSRQSGDFVNTVSGVATSGDFTGTVSEWYETLVEVVNDVSADIHRKTLRGGANFLVCGPEVANILEFTSGFRASITHDDDKGTVGNYKDGSINKKWDVYVDPYFPRNIILVGRKGSSFLESGYVYAPYVPLQTTPTIFGPEDFTPRKGVMTRYGKKMVRPDMYGLVVVKKLNVP